MNSPPGLRSSGSRRAHEAGTGNPHRGTWGPAMTGDNTASAPDYRSDALDELEAAADLVRPAILDPHTAADLVLDAGAHSCVPNDLFCYICEIQVEQREGRRV